MLIKKYSYINLLRKHNLLLDPQAREVLNNKLDGFVIKFVEEIVKDLASQSKSDYSFQPEDVEFYFKNLEQEELTFSFKDDE